MRDDNDEEPGKKFKIVRFYQGDRPNRVMKRGLTLSEAQAHCQDPETSSRTCKHAKNVAHTRQWGPWFDGYADDEGK